MLAWPCLNIVGMLDCLWFIWKSLILKSCHLLNIFMCLVSWPYFEASHGKDLAAVTVRAWISQADRCGGCVASWRAAGVCAWRVIREQ